MAMNLVARPSRLRVRAASRRSNELGARRPKNPPSRNPLERARRIYTIRCVPEFYRKAALRFFWKAFLVGAVLLGIVLLTPHSGLKGIRSCFQIAISSNWAHYLEWSAAWCSFKIVLLFIGAMMFIVALAYFFECRGKEMRAEGLLLWAAFPMLGALWGFFQLFRALL